MMDSSSSSSSSCRWMQCKCIHGRVGMKREGKRSRMRRMYAWMPCRFWLVLLVPGLAFRTTTPRLSRRTPRIITCFSHDDKNKQERLHQSEQSAAAATTTSALLLLDWITQQDDGWVSPSLDIGPSTVSSGAAGNGIFVRNDTSAGQELLCIPNAAILSVDKAWDDPQLGIAFCELSDEGGHGGRLAALAAFVAAQHVAVLPHDSRSFFQPYLDYIFATKQDHVLWWTAQDVEHLLQGSNVYQQVAKLRTDVDTSTEILLAVLATELSDDNVDEKMDRNAWKIAIRQAYVAIYSRAFADDSVDCTKLIPVFDMAQHNDTPNIRHTTDPRTGDVHVIALTDLAAGTELFINYGVTGQDSNSSDKSSRNDMSLFFPTYGFCPAQGEESCRALLQAKSNIFFDDDGFSRGN